MSRQSIMTQLVEVIATEGTSGLTVREVAKRAGVSIGTVQHYFPTRAAMLIAAVDSIGEVTTGIYAEAAGRSDPADRLRAVCRLLVPSADSGAPGRVWLAFAAQSLVDEAVAERYREIWRSLQRRLRDLLAEAVPQLSFADADREAAELLALLDGLAVAVLTDEERLSGEAAGRIVDRAVDRLLAARS